MRKQLIIPFSDSYSSSISETLASGNYYIKISGHGYGDPENGNTLAINNSYNYTISDISCINPPNINLCFDDNYNCTTGELMILNMYDSYGDGWNGNTLSLDQIDFTIEEGNSAYYSVCVNQDECFQITCDGGSWQS